MAEEVLNMTESNVFYDDKGRAYRKQRVPEQDIERPTVAEQAANMLKLEKENIEVEANLSDDPKTQYVDVFVQETCDGSRMRFSTHRAIHEKLAERNIYMDGINCFKDNDEGLNGQDYRIWWTEVEKDERPDSMWVVLSDGHPVSVEPTREDAASFVDVHTINTITDKNWSAYKMEKDGDAYVNQGTDQMVEF